MRAIPTWEDMMVAAYRHMACDPPDLDYARLALDYAREIRIADGEAGKARGAGTKSRTPAEPNRRAPARPKGV